MTKFLTAKEIAEITRCSENYAYKLIRKLNAELAEKGYLTIRARVPAAYFYHRVFGGENVEK